MLSPAIILCKAVDKKNQAPSHTHTEPSLVIVLEKLVEKQQFTNAINLIDKKYSAGHLHHDSAFYLKSRIYLKQNNFKEWKNNLLKIKKSQFLNNVKIVSDLFEELDFENKKWLAKNLMGQRIFDKAVPSSCPFYELNERARRGNFLSNVLEVAELDKKTRTHFYEELYLEKPESIDVARFSSNKKFIKCHNKLTAQDYTKRMLNLMLFGKNKEARETYEKARSSLKKISKDERCELDYQNAKIERKMRNYKGARLAFQTLIKTCGSEVKRKARYMELMLASMASDVSQRAQFDQFVKDYPTDGLSDDVLFFAADMERTVGKYDDMFKTLDILIKKYPDGDMIHKALFSKAFELTKLGELELAAKSLEHLKKISHPDSLSFQQAQYWITRLSISKDIKTFKALNKNKLSTIKSQLMALVHHKIPTVYSWLSWLLLKELKVHVPLKKIAAQKIEGLQTSKDPELILTNQLIENGFNKEALALLLEKSVKSSDEASVFFIAKLFLDLDDAHLAYLKLIQCNFKAGQILRARPGIYNAIAFPRPFKEEVREATQRSHVSPNLVYPIMKRESCFLPDARSWAQARGLMMMMKVSADEQAQRMGIKLQSEEDLYKPKTSLLLGAGLIKNYQQRFGNLAVALAAYNAGPGHAQRWITKNNHAPIDAFLENVSIDETNRYLKNVLGGMFHYSLMDPNAQLNELDFLLKNDNSDVSSSKSKA